MACDLVLKGPTYDITIGDGYRTFIIAEIGQNHQGDVNLAKKLILEAKEAGADCVKFQKTCLAERFTPNALSRPYDSKNSFGSTYGEHRQHLELSDEEFNTLQQYAQSLNILFSASAMDLISLDKMAAMNVPFIKIGSGDANNFVLIEKAAKLNIPLIVSTGMQTMSTVNKIYKIISAHHKHFVLMHCVSSYPTVHEDANLGLIKVYKDKFPDVHIGYSGHEDGCISEIAVAIGAKVVERHFTLDKAMKGSDHGCSLNPTEFKEMVEKIRNIEVILGSLEKKILKSEETCRSKLGKSLVAAKTLNSGDIVCLVDIAVKVSHPPGIPGEFIEDIIGLKVINTVEKEDRFDWDNLSHV